MKIQVKTRTVIRRKLHRNFAPSVIRSRNVQRPWVQSSIQDAPQPRQTLYLYWSDYLKPPQRSTSAAPNQMK